MGQAILNFINEGIGNSEVGNSELGIGNSANSTPHSLNNSLITTPHSPLPIPPFRWDENQRAKLRAELDAKYAQLYGLSRDELRYILDPADIHGPDFPSETFRVLKNNEIKKYGEYRTQRLVLAAWDILEK